MLAGPAGIAADDVSSASSTPAVTPAASPWIESPRWDLFWIFAGLWAPLLAIAGYLLLHGTGTAASQRAFGTGIEGIAFIYLPLSVLHRITTTYAVLGTPILRDERRANPARYYYVPLAITAGCILLALAFTFHDAFAFMPSLHGRLWAFFLLAYVMYAWERWHFCAQEFGVLSIYRVRARQSAPEDKRFDRVFTIWLMLVVNTVLVFRAGFHELRDVMLYGTPLVGYRGALLEPVALCAFASGLLLSAAAVARELRHPQRSLPKLAFYVLVSGHSLVLYFLPNSLGLFFLSYVFHHWMVSVGLFSRITLNAFDATPAHSDKPARSPLAQLFFGVGPFLIATLVLYLTCEQLDRAGNLYPLPTAQIFAGAAPFAKVLAGVIIGLFFAVNYLHYYYDRCFYAFSSPAVRKTVGAALFRSPSSGRRSPPVATAVPAGGIGQDAAAG
jgi:hypothetical protein